MRRLIFGLMTLILLSTEVLIALYGHGWVRIYLGDVLVVILLYTLIRTIFPYKIRRWYLLPAAILLFAFAVEFLQLWGICDRLGITNRFLRTVIGTGFSKIDLACYLIGIIPCFISDFLLAKSNSSG